MRPLRLVIEGFKPFKGRQDIDFSNLEFFVIRGPTGSGKSSILDAIRFALFGKKPDGSDKNLDELINLSSQSMFINFTFSVKGKVFNITRRKQRGKASSVRLTVDGVPRGSTNAAVNKEIERALGVNAEQFEKLFFIPQGRYAEFFNTTPARRRELIISLLNLEIYQKLGEALGQELSEVEQKLSHLEGIFEGLKEYTLQRLKQLKEELKKVEISLQRLRKEKSLLEEKLKKLQRLKELIDQQRRLREELENLKGENLEKLRKEVEFLRKLSPFAGKLQKYLFLKGELEKVEEDIRRTKGEINHLQREIENLQHRKGELEKELKTHTGQREIIEDYKGILANLERLEPKLEELKKKLKRIKEEEKKLSEQRERLEKLKNRYRDLLKEVETLKGELERVEYSPEREIKLVSELQRAEEFRRLSLEREKLLSEISQTEGEINRLNNLLEEKEKELKKLLEKLEELKKRERDYLIYLLVRDLKEGEPCPICGCPYKGEKHFVETDFDPNLLEELEGSIETLKGEIEELKRLRAVKEAELNRLRENLLEIENRIGEMGNVKPLEEVKRELESLRREKQLMEKLQKELEKKEKLLEELREEIHKLEVEIEGEEKSLRSERALLEGETKEIKDFLAKVKERTKITPPKGQNPFIYLKNEIGKKVGEYEERLERLRNGLAEVERKLSSAEAELKKVEETLRGLLEKRENLLVELKTIEGELQKVSVKPQSIPKLVKALEELPQKEEELKAIEGKLENLKLRLEEVEREINTCGGLDLQELPEVEKKIETLKGEEEKLLQRKGYLTEEISLTVERIEEKRQLEEELEILRKREAVLKVLKEDFKSNKLIDFVVDKALSDVVEIAGENLFKLTDRYRFTLKGGNIYVLDLFEESERNVKTLSGGETFLASVSFALALGEYVGSNAAVESLFIDEGFGTLDKERLEKLGNLFETLRLKLDKVVGIITHLEELSQFFDQQILVEKTPAGSRVRVIF